MRRRGDKALAVIRAVNRSARTGVLWGAGGG